MTGIRGCIDCRRIDVNPDVNHRCKDCAAKVPQPWTPPEYLKQDLRYRAGDLRQEIRREEELGRNSALLHAARRVAKTIDELLKPDKTTINSDLIVETDDTE